MSKGRRVSLLLSNLACSSQDLEATQVLPVSRDQEVTLAQLETLVLLAQGVPVAEKVFLVLTDCLDLLALESPSLCLCWGVWEWVLTAVRDQAAVTRQPWQSRSWPE